MVVRGAVRVVGWIGGAAVVAFAVLPLWYVLMLSLDPDPVTAGGSLLPRAVTMDNYRFLASPQVGFYPAVGRTLLLSAGTTAAAMALAVPAAYALGRLPVRGASRILPALLTLAFFPGILLLIPLRTVYRDLGWTDQLATIGLTQLSYALPIAVWFLAYAFREVPVELEEAAILDGASVLQRIVGILLPIARSGVAATVAVVFVLTWNDFLFTSALTQTPRSEVVSVTMAKLPVLGFAGVQMAAGVLVTAPVFLVVAGLQRWLVGHVAMRGG